MNQQHSITSVFLLIGFTLGLSHHVNAERPASADLASLPSVADKTKRMREYAGFFNFWWDENTGRIWLKIDRFGEEFLYVNSLSTGMGSNPVGLDRGQLGRSRVVRFTRIGPRVFLEQRNLRYRALTKDAAERRAVEESFAHSVLWGADVAAETDGDVLVDATDFLLRDAHNVVGRLEDRDQNDFHLDPSRCAVYLPRTRSFPKNTEFEVTLTFESSDPGAYVRETTPTPGAMTLRQHHSFVELPVVGYRPRRFDPRAPSMAITFADYAMPIDEPLEKQWILRHRLRKKQPGEAVSEPVEPIVYYVDPGAPEPVRSALIEGASWWNQAFEAAGFKNAFRVELLPEDADPLDVRFNTIMWVHRSTRGWSYGNSVIDPRTGEILKGHVTLGSLRVRQDLLLVDGLTPSSPENSLEPGQACGCGCAELAAVERVFADLDPAADSNEIALSRIRQLSAHEVGHTLGFVHNFAASTYGRASVMDYPAPLVHITDSNELDLSDAYGVGIGKWDVFAVKYAYSEFPAGSEEPVELEQLVNEAISDEMVFLSDADARPTGAAHPLANLWDNGKDPVDALEHTLRVRQIALERFGKQNLSTGEAWADLESTLVPLYLHHRYQVDATAKLLGGAYYNYALVGDGQPPLEWVPVERQRLALKALLRCLEPERLAIPERLLSQMPPQPFGSRKRELFPKRTAMLFDPEAAAEVAAKMVVSNLLQHQRAARLLSEHQRRAGFDLKELIDQLLSATWYADPPEDIANTAPLLVVQRVVLHQLIELAGNSSATPGVRAVTTSALRRLKKKLERNRGTPRDDLVQAHRKLAVGDITRFLARPHETARPAQSLETPPGSPIGGQTP